MAILSYRQPGLSLTRAGGGASEPQVRDLQRDLRRLGYLKRGIDGDFGGQTELAVKGLQHDLLHNSGDGKDGAAPVSGPFSVEPLSCAPLAAVPLALSDCHNSPCCPPWSRKTGSWFRPSSKIATPESASHTTSPWLQPPPTKNANGTDIQRERHLKQSIR